MRPINIYIEKNADNTLDTDEIKYAFRTLLIIAGYSFTFTDDGHSLDADICYGEKPSGNCGLFIKAERIDRDKVKTPAWISRADGLPFFGFGSENIDRGIVSRDNGRTCVWNDIILSSFYFLTGWQERYISRDSKDRHHIEESYLYKNNMLGEAPVSKYAIFLGEALKRYGDPAPLWPSGKKYAVALSHDVDYPEMIKSIELARYLLICKGRVSMPKVLDIMNGKENFWRFRDWVTLEKKFGLTSAFYFCGFKGSLLRYFTVAPDPFYDVKKPCFREIMRELDGAGCEIGMHASYLAYRFPDMFGAEKAEVENALGKKIFGNRHHYWHMDPDNTSDTALIHEQAGLAYDSSLSFERRPGFRRGISAPFHIYHPSGKRYINCLQLPPTLMDDHLFGHARYSRFPDWKSEVDALIDATRNTGGVFSADYHVRGFNETFYPGWRESYEYAIGKITGHDDFYCDTPVNIARHFLDREERLIKASG